MIKKLINYIKENIELIILQSSLVIYLSIIAFCELYLKCCNNTMIMVSLSGFMFLIMVGLGCIGRSNNKVEISRIKLIESLYKK